MSGPSTGALRVLTINAMAPEYADGPARRANLRAELRRLAPDVVALQEVVRTDGRDEAAELLGDGWHIAWCSVRTADGLGSALAARWPFGRRREVDGGAPVRDGSFWYVSLLAEVEAPPPFGPLLLVHHKPVWRYGHEPERELHAVATARAAEEMLAGTDRHAILLGDLDAAPDSAAVRFLTGRQSLHGAGACYQDAWAALRPDDPGHTFTPHNPLVRAGDMPTGPGRRIDYVMVRCSSWGPTLEVVACDRVGTDPSAPISDHYGIVADLRVPPRPPGTFAPGFTAPRDGTSR
ncbi:MAG TPA: endonuclease/exonuclease/phosphatase family protein [Streptosporangiaceae bacterium]|jgi:endonuclease/exonuclease/phosphatase family metal-dependent hydrolase